MVTNPSLRFKHALVTGATGIVGVPLVHELLSCRVLVSTFTRGVTQVGFPSKVVNLSGDIANTNQVIKASEDKDVIFHVAAVKNNSSSSYSEFERINVNGTKNVITAARTVGARLVYVSTVNVDGFRRGRLFDYYSESKSEAEKLVSKAVDDGLDAVIVRPAMVFGSVGGRAGLIVDSLLSGGLRVLPAPERRINPVWSVDLARALISAAEDGHLGTAYTVAGSTLRTGDFVAQVCEARKLRKPLLSLPAWLFIAPLKLAWWARPITRWQPPISVGTLVGGSTYHDYDSAFELGFSHTSIKDIFE